MGDRDAHQNQYLENKKLLRESIFNKQSTIYYDWMLTIIFYCSLHLVEKYISKKVHKHNMRHYERNNYVCCDPFLKPIAQEYNTLYSESIRARYSCEKITKDDVKFAEVLLKRIEEKLLAI